jgi:DNA-binding transcriptional regulator YdaS (Cro superfamily)
MQAQGIGMAKAVYQRSVEMAAEILGSNDAVAGYLGVNPAEVLAWVEGRAEPAINLFLRLVDLIEQSTVSAARTATVVRSKRDEKG